MSSKMQARRNLLSRYVDLSDCRGLEIGPLDSPVVPSGNNNVKYADYLSYEQLIDKYAEKKNAEKIVRPDFVLGAQSLSENIDEKFDYVVACHVIEHVANMIAWLRDIGELLTPSGILLLAVPDKRYTFDILRPTTPLSHLLNDFHRGVSRPDLEHVFDHIFLKRNIKPEMVWDQRLPKDLASRAAISQKDAYARAVRILKETEYAAVHCHVFTTEGFLEIIRSLEQMGLIPFRAATSVAPQRPYGEFLVVLKKGEADGPIPPGTASARSAEEALASEP